MTFRTIALVVSALSFAGCDQGGGDKGGGGKGGAGTGAAGAGTATASPATPKGAVVAMQAALVKDDRTGFLGSYKADDGQQKMLGSVFDVSEQVQKIRSALEKSYGPQGPQQFQENLGPFGGTKLGMEPMSQDQISNMQVAEHGDQATVTVSGEKPMDLVKENGKWLIDAKQMFGAASVNPDQFSQFVDKVKPAAQKVLEQVGKPGQTPKSLATLFVQTMLPGGGAAPDASSLLKKAQEQAAGGGLQLPKGLPGLPAPPAGAEAK
jgi:hypothetical protein